MQTEKTMNPSEFKSVEKYYAMPETTDQAIFDVRE
jgi:hypothetical protein